VTLHLPWSLADGRTLKADKMSSTNPNLIPSDVMSFMRQREHMRKNILLDFRFNRLRPFNFQFGCRPKSSNHIILVLAHPISKLKIDPEISWLRELMVRNPFLYFECFTSGNTCDSSPPLRDKIKPVTAKKFLKHGFSFFHRILPFSFDYRLRWHFGCLI
jgi:hypothetical protein